MSLAGQWVAEYEGTNKGTLVLDIEASGDRYHCLACAWDNNQNLPSSLVRFVTDSKEPSQTLRKIKILAIAPGQFLTTEQLQGLKNNSGVLFPDDAEIAINLRSPSSLEISWKTSIGTNGATTALVSPTCGGEPSVLKPIEEISTWDSFKAYVSRLPSNRFAFRGQEHAQWRLRTSFHRSKRCILERFLLDDVAALQRVFSSLSSHRYNINDPHDYGAFLSLAQHHGYPTPLLDWTWSPYVAAFFSYRNLRNGCGYEESDKVRILKFPAYDWNIQIPQIRGLFPYPPHVSLMEPLALGNARAIPQQAIAMVTNIDDIESYLSKFDTRLGVPALEAIDLPASARQEVMRDLAMMGITSASLFPGLDGACEALREKNFHFV
jgi:hypothetical protein